MLNNLGHYVYFTMLPLDLIPNNMLNIYNMVSWGVL